MKEVKLLSTSQIRLFPQDMIPITKLILADGRNAVSYLFNFQSIEPLEAQGSLLGVKFQSGSYGPKATFIHQVSIEPQKIVVQVEGTSKEAYSVYDGLKKKLGELNDNRAIKEILCTHETTCSVVLEVPFERVFSSYFLSFIEKSAIKYTRNRWSQNYIVPTNLKFSVRYKVTDDTLTNTSTTLATKELTIEPRARSDPKDRLYWIASPTDTDTHLKLIDDLEKSLKGEVKSRSRSAN